MSFFTPRSSTFITPGLWANAIASCASASGNARVTSGLGSTFPERSRAIALSKGPHREPTTLISFTTIGHVSWRGASGNVADRGEGNQRRRFAVRTLRQGDGPAAFGESGSQTACYASVSAGGSARSDSVCPETWRDEGAAPGREERHDLETRRRSFSRVMADPRGAGVSLAVDAGGDAGSAEAVVDVDDGDVGGAGIEHAEERGYAAEARAVADAGWHGNHRRGDETANDAGKGAFHSRNANDDAGLRELAFAVLEQAMNPGDADVVELIDTVAHHVRREKRFFR